MNTRVAILEEKVSVYEQMLNKLDDAIHAISKTSQSISKMLAVHEEKLENTEKTEAIIFDKLRDIQSKNTVEHEKVISKFNDLEQKIETRVGTLNTKVDEITKYRWIVVGALVIVSFIFSQSSIVVDILTPEQSGAKIEKVK